MHAVCLTSSCAQAAGDSRKNTPFPALKLLTLNPLGLSSTILHFPFLTPEWEVQLWQPEPRPSFIPEQFPNPISASSLRLELLLNLPFSASASVWRVGMGNQGLRATRFSCSCGLGLFFGLVWFGFLRWKIELIELDLIRDLLFVSFFFFLRKANIVFLR